MSGLPYCLDCLPVYGLPYCLDSLDSMVFLAHCALHVWPMLSHLTLTEVSMVKLIHCVLHLIVNVRGSFLMTKYSLKEMKKNDYGRILHLASIAGKEVH